MRRGRDRRERRGFSLPELIIAMVIFGVVMTAVLSVVLSVQRGFVRSRDTARADAALRTGESAISSALRSAGANPQDITGGSAPGILPDPDGNGVFDDIRIRSDFYRSDGDVADTLEDVEFRVRADSLQARWVAGGAFGAIAFPIRSIRFQYLRADGVAIPTAANISQAVAVRLTLSAPRPPPSTTLIERQTWIYLRNVQ